MRKILFCLIILSCSICISAQKIRIRSGETGEIFVTQGKRRATIDLSRNIAGCPYVPARDKRDLDKKSCAAPPVTFKLIEAVTKNKQTFLIIEAEAMDNCNVCGQCGATEAYALIWLKMNSRLRVLEKKTAIYEDCRANISYLDSKAATDENKQYQSPEFKAGFLILEYEQRIYNRNSDPENYEFSRLEYNRKTPEKGFVIKTEKRSKSSAQPN